MPDSSGFPCQIPTTAPGEAWRDVLRDAASILEQRGRCPETWGVPSGRALTGEICPANAVFEAAGSNDIVIADACKNFDKWSGGHCFVTLNMYAKSDAEVTAALRACAESVP